MLKPEPKLKATSCLLSGSSFSFGPQGDCGYTPRIYWAPRGNLWKDLSRSSLEQSDCVFYHGASIHT